MVHITSFASFLFTSNLGFLLGFKFIQFNVSNPRPFYPDFKQLYFFLQLLCTCTSSWSYFAFAFRMNFYLVKKSITFFQLIKYCLQDQAHGEDVHNNWRRKCTCIYQLEKKCDFLNQVKILGPEILKR